MEQAGSLARSERGAGNDGEPERGRGGCARCDAPVRGRRDRRGRAARRLRDIAPGKATAVMGPSGSGKSTLMHILAGLDKPTTGDVEVAGTEITTLGDNDLTKLRREHIGFVFQFFNLLPMLDAKENILLPLTIAGEKPEDGWFDQLVGDVGLSDRLSHRPGGAVGRAAAACRHRPRARLEADGSLRGRAHRKPRLGDERGDPRAPAPLGRRIRPDDRHGDPRRTRRGCRASRALPRRRRDRARARRMRPAHDPRCIGGARRRVIKVALRGLAGRKLRAVLTGVAIVLGVAMISGTYILTDTVQRAFNDLLVDSYAVTDAVVTGKGLDISIDGENLLRPRSTPRCSTSCAASTRSPWRPAASSTSGTRAVLTPEGGSVNSEGWPTLGFGIDTDPALAQFNPLNLFEGRWPAGDDEIVIDAGTADEQGFEVGDTVQVSTLQPKRPFELVGVAKYGEVDSLGGISFVVFTIPAAQELLGREVSTTRSRWPPGRGSPRTTSSRRSPCSPYERRGRQCGGRGRGAGERGERVHDDLQVLPPHVRLHRALRGQLRHLQHVLDHGCAAHTRVRDAADDRSVATPDSRIRDPRIARDRAVASLAGLGLGVVLAEGDRSALRESRCRASERRSSLRHQDDRRSLVVGIGITLLAGLFPAIRATRVPPIAAVREGAVLPKSRFAPFVPWVAALVVAAALVVLARRCSPTRWGQSTGCSRSPPASSSSSSA